MEPRRDGRIDYGAHFYGSNVCRTILRHIEYVGFPYIIHRNYTLDSRDRGMYLHNVVLHEEVCSREPQGLITNCLYKGRRLVLPLNFNIKRGKYNEEHTLS